MLVTATYSRKAGYDQACTSTRLESSVHMRVQLGPHVFSA